MIKIDNAKVVAKARAAKQAEIDALEAKALMTRRFREKEIEDNLREVIAAGYTHDFAYANNFYYRTTWDENESAKLLRSQLKALK